MDKLAQVLGILRALRSIATQANYTDVYKGMETQCISTYRKCVSILKTVKDYEEIESIAPELSDSANMKEIGFAVEMLLSVVRSEEGHGPAFGFGMHIPHGGRGPRAPKIQWRQGPGRFAMHASPSCGPRHRGDRGIDRELHREMREKIEEEQEQFEEEIEEIEDEIEELQDKIEEARDRLEERLEEIREKYEERIEDLQDKEDDDQDEDENEDDTGDEDEPKS